MREATRNLVAATPKSIILGRARDKPSIQVNDCPPAKKARTQKESLHQKNADPAVDLNDECMLQVLSFVGATNNDSSAGEDSSTAAAASPEGVTPPNQGGRQSNQQASPSACHCGYSYTSDAFKFYQHLASVSRQWKRSMDQSLTKLVPLLEVNFHGMPNGKKVSLAEWVCSHKLRVGRLVCSEADARLLPLATKILAQCDTSDLTHATVRLCLMDNSSCLFAAQRAFHDALAKECPKLHCLAVGLDVDEGNANTAAVSQLLFSHASIDQLNITVLKAPNARGIADGRILCNLMQNLPNLQGLYLHCKEPVLLSLGAESRQPAVIHVVSPSIKMLRVDGFCTRRALFGLNCPRLRFCSIAVSTHMVGTAHEREPTLRVAQNIIIDGVQRVPTDCVGLLCPRDLPPNFPPLSVTFQVLLEVMHGAAPLLAEAVPVPAENAP